jgi:hypothetical protein
MYTHMKSTSSMLADMQFDAQGTPNTSYVQICTPQNIDAILDFGWRLQVYVWQDPKQHESLRA